MKIDIQLIKANWIDTIDISLVTFFFSISNSISYHHDYRKKIILPQYFILLFSILLHHMIYEFSFHNTIQLLFHFSLLQSLRHLANRGPNTFYNKMYACTSLYPFSPEILFEYSVFVKENTPRNKSRDLATG